MTGPQIKALRKRLHLTQGEFARKLGVQPFQVYRWEQGIARPQPRNQRKLNRLKEKP